MIQTAIEKINTEMQKDPGNTFLEVIGHYLIDRSQDPVVAAAVCNSSKSLSGAVEKIMATARSKAKKNAAVMAPYQVFGIVDTYFSIPNDAAAQEKAMLTVAGPVQVAAPAAPAGKLVSLDFDSFV